MLVSNIVNTGGIEPIQLSRHDNRSSKNVADHIGAENRPDRGGGSHGHTLRNHVTASAASASRIPSSCRSARTALAPPDAGGQLFFYW